MCWLVVGEKRCRGEGQVYRGDWKGDLWNGGRREVVVEVMGKEEECGEFEVCCERRTTVVGLKVKEKKD